VKQIGENDNPKFAELWVFGIIPGTIEAFLLDMEAKTHVIVFDQARNNGTFTNHSKPRG